MCKCYNKCRNSIKDGGNIIIRQQAFIDKGNKMLKGGLHCHTTRSDGAGAPDEVIRLHVQNGYDFLAITDHRQYNFQNFAPEQDIVIVPGMEIDRNLEKLFTEGMKANISPAGITTLASA